MSVDQTDKLSNETAAGTATVQPPRRPRAAIWPIDTGASEDTFATPSAKPSGEVDPASLVGPEPAVFGGTNPTTAEGAGSPTEGQAAEAQPAANDPLGTPLDEAVRGDEMLPEAPRINYPRLIRSTPFLLTSMILLLIGANYFVRMAIQTECYVQTSVKFSNYDKLSENEIADLQTEMKALLRTYPLQKRAWEILQKKSPDVQPGFLNGGLAFHRLDAITWDQTGTVRLRVDSDEPSDDLTRLSAITEAFYAELENRLKNLDEYRKSLQEQKDKRAGLLEKDAQLKTRVDALLPGAQDYLDLKKKMQELERYVELTDDTNPLRLVARQNLALKARQVTDARKLSVERDDLLGQRVELQTKAETAAGEMVRLQRQIDVFSVPEPPDPSHLVVHDTRDYQKLILRGTWVAIIGSFGGLIVMFHLMDIRENERIRRERRALLNAQTARGRK